MNTKKAVKLFVIILLFISAVALAGLNIYQHRQIQEAAQSTSGGNTSSNDSAADLMPGNATDSFQTSQLNQSVSGRKSQTVDSEIDELLYQIDAAEEELSMINEQLAADEAKKLARKKIEKELQKKYHENLALKNAIKESIDSQFADLINKLNLSPEKLDSFKDLIVEGDFAQENLLMEYGDISDLSKEEREEFTRRSMALNEQYESEIEALLGESEYATYQTYSQTQGERYKVNNFSEYLDPVEALTETQKEALIEAMHEELEYVIYEKADNASKASSEESMARRISNYSLTNEAYLKAANSVLSTAQIEKFETYLEEETERYRLILEMSALKSSTSDDTDNVAVRVE